MLQIFYLEVIENQTVLIFMRKQLFFLCFHSFPVCSGISWKRRSVRDQPQGQNGLFAFEFKANVNGLNSCMT